MSELANQASFNSGEWSPALNARVDLQKYRSGAALLENFFVDYRGGASSRAGTKYILQAYKSATAVRLISFQASFDIGYALEFGDGYIRFFIDGAPVLEDSFAITGATKANPCVLTIAGNDFVIGQWIFLAAIGGMTQLNGRYVTVLNVVGAAVTIGDLNGNPINSTSFTTYTAGGTASRVYTISSPYAAADLAKLKFAQNVNQLILCHPSYQPYVLTLITAENWTLLPIVFGTTATTPGIPSLQTSLGAGAVAYSYVITAIDGGGQESAPSPAAVLLNTEDLRTVAGTIRLSWTAVPGAVLYNIYKADVSYFGTVPAGAIYGYIGFCDGVEFVDSNIGADFSQTPPILRNPFEGSGIDHVTLLTSGTYTTVPTASLTGAASTIAGALAVVLGVIGIPTVGSGGAGYAPGDTLLFTNNVVLTVDTVSAGAITAFLDVSSPTSNTGSLTAGSTPANPVVQVSTSGGGTGATANLVWGVNHILVLNSGAGYTSVPTVTFSSGAATATAVLGAASNGYPSVPGFFQQRLVLAAPTGAPQTFYMSQPGAFFNYNESLPIRASDAITGTLVSGQLNTIKSMVSQNAGLLILSDKASWIINGGTGPGSAVSPAQIVANAQSFNGASDVPPIVANFDVLYVQSKGSIVRDSAYNIYANVFTGTDISVIASHLFYGFQVLEWAWAEEPYKVVWALRNDGVMLTLTFLKEQEFVGWAHSITQGSFTSVCVVTESTVDSGEVDAIYIVVERIVQGLTLKYIERFAERTFANGAEDAWCVDSALQYDGPPATHFFGAEHLAGLTVTGLADGEVITPFVMPINGEFILPSASKVTVGLGFTCKLKTLAIDLGEPTVQGKVKKIPHVDIRVKDTLGLKIGNDFNNLTLMKDLIRGNVGSMLTGQESQIVTDLYTGDARTYMTPAYTVPGQYCIQQDLPLPASILGVIPAFAIGDSK